MKLNEIMVTEGFSPIVYHATTMQRALSILKTDKVYTNPASIISNSERLTSRVGQYVSFTRSLNSSFIRGLFDEDQYAISVVFEVDGRKLSQKYRGEPVEYWRKNTMFGMDDSLEYEDRLVTDNAWVTDFSKFIKSITIVYNTLYDDDGRIMISNQHDIFFSLVRAAKKIPTFVAQWNPSAVLRNRISATDVIRKIKKEQGNIKASIKSANSRYIKDRSVGDSHISTIKGSDEDVFYGSVYGFILAIKNGDARAMDSIVKKYPKAKEWIVELPFEHPFSLSSAVAYSTTERRVRFLKLFRSMGIDPVHSDNWRENLYRRIKTNPSLLNYVSRFSKKGWE